MMTSSSCAMTFFQVGLRPAFFRYYSRVPTRLSMQAPAEGGAQTALATVAAQLGKRATIFVAQRAQLHPRTLMAKRLGAQIVQVSSGYLNVVQARAREYSHQTGALLAPFGFDIPGAAQAIAAAARSIGIQPDEVWCAGGSGVLGARSSSSLAECQPTCRPGWPRVKSQRRGRRNDSRISQEVRMGD